MAKGNNGLMKGAAIVAGIAAAVALAQVLKTKKAKMLKKVAHDANEHVMAHAKKLGKFSQASYSKIVDSVLGEFGNMKALSQKELAALSGELKAGWKQAEKNLKKA